MTPLDLMQSRQALLRLVIFDCDGVLVDSEPITNQITAEELTTLGWPMTAEDSVREFLGLTFTDMMPIIERRIGRKLPPDWRDHIVRRLVAALGAKVEAIPGALEALDGLRALGMPWRVASNSSHAEMDAKFARLGISDRVNGRTHSHRDVGHGKPAPDLFLVAAAAEGVAPAECVVIEDSGPGVRAAMAAGMDCLAYAPNGEAAALAALGAVPFHSMLEVPALIGAALRRTT